MICIKQKKHWFVGKLKEPVKFQRNIYRVKAFNKEDAAEKIRQILGHDEFWLRLCFTTELSPREPLKFKLSQENR